MKMILSLLWMLWRDEAGTLGITQASLCSAVADMTGDDSSDAVVKIKRLINQVGPDFCLITNWPFLHELVSFNIDTSGYKFSGASYLPTTFRKVVGARILDQNSEWFPLYEEGINEVMTNWLNPTNNTGRPDKFCIPGQIAGYWEIQFNRKPDTTYTVDLEIEKQWVDVTVSVEAVVTKEYFTAFAHFISIARFFQQGDLESYAMAKDAWSDPVNPRNGMLGRILAALSSPTKRKGVKADERMLSGAGRTKRDYRWKGW